MGEKLFLFRVVMKSFLGEKDELYYVMPSQKVAEERWHREYGKSSWKFVCVVLIDSIDGHQVSFS